MKGRTAAYISYVHIGAGSDHRHDALILGVKCRVMKGCPEGERENRDKSETFSTVFCNKDIHAN